MREWLAAELENSSQAKKCLQKMAAAKQM